MRPFMRLAQDEYKDEPGTVIAADFYHANQLLPLSDEEIIAKVHRNITLCEPAFAAAKVLIHGCPPRLLHVQRK